MQGCGPKWHPLFHGLLGNMNGHFTPVVALKYYATCKIPARIISRARRKEVTIYNNKRAADWLQRLVIELSLKEGMLICTKLYQALDSPRMLLYRQSNQSEWSVWMAELDLSFSFQKILQISDLSNKLKKSINPILVYQLNPLRCFEDNLERSIEITISEKNYQYRCLFSRVCSIVFSRIDKKLET